MPMKQVIPIYAESPGRRLGQTILFALFLLLLIAFPSALEAAGQTYYINNLPAVSCSDSASGTDPAAPWCSFAPLAGVALEPGDQVLIARGASFTEQVNIASPKGSVESPVVIDAYGEGPRPRFLYNGTSTAMSITNPSHVIVRNLDIGDTTNAGRGAFHYGLRVDFSTLGNTNVVLEDLYVHDNRVVGIFVRNTAELLRTDTAIDGITLRNIETTHNAHGIVFASQGTVLNPAATATPDTSANRIFRNILVEGLYQHNDDNNNPPPSQVFAQIDAGCPDSLAFGSASNIIVRNSVLDGSAGCRTNAGTAALYLGTVRDAVIANNVFINTPNTENPDMVAIDHEASTHNILIAGNYFADNYGGGIEYLAIHGSNDYSTGNSIRGNVFVRNGYTHNIPYPGGGSISQLGNGIIPDAVIADNIAYEPYAFLTAHLRGTVSRMTLANNLQLEDADWIFHSAADYGSSSSPWSYQRSTASGWSNLPYVPAADAYQDGDVSVSRFELAPGADAAAGLAWTAPRAGKIAIRSYPMAASGVSQVSITVNGQELVTASVDAAGEVLLADGIAVETGDVVCFQAPAGSSQVSWTPSVSYTGAAAATDGFGEWSFSVDGDAQGWTSDSLLKVTAGSLMTAASPSGTVLTSPDGLNIDAAASTAVRIRLANGSSLNTGQVLFRAAGEAFSPARSADFAVNPRENNGLAEGFVDVLVPLDADQGWSGVIDQLQIKLGGGEGQIRIDSVQLANPAGPRWDFDTDEGWKINPDISCAPAGTPALDPQLDVDNGNGSFSKAADINWNMARAQSFRVSTGTLAQLDVWTYKTGNPAGCMYIRVVDSNNKALFTGAVPPSAVTAGGGYVSVYPGLTGLDPNELYRWQIFSPYVVPGGGNYGFGYNDASLYPEGGAYYSINGRGTWGGPETQGRRSLRFRTYSATQLQTPPVEEGYAPVTVAAGEIIGSGGYEPALLSPDNLGIDAATERYVHIRMSNPDNRLTAYLLFTTEAAPEFDIPEGGWPPANEVEGRGIVFPLVPGGQMVDYVLDMSTIPAWSGTVKRLMIQPSYRWSYRISSLSSTWSGSIDWVFVDDGATGAVEAGNGNSDNGGGEQ